ncbi:MAG: NAD(P)H-dependent oxidoreductase subunit E, partial [Gammaproteobacteria bacterium]|nr:NAD(P)H-dependent oxidoreductase subunit E [Gammaproteobacteria bacterium]
MPIFNPTKGQFRGRQVSAQALTEIRNLLGAESRQRDLLIEHLHKIQDHYHQLSAAHLVALADEMKLAVAEVYEVASFYHHFDVVKETEPAINSITIRVCNSISCEMAGSEQLFATLKSTFGAHLRIQQVPCVGRCAQAPVALVGSNPIEQASVERVQSAIDNDQIAASGYSPSISFSQYRTAQGYTLLADCVGGKQPVDSIIQTLEAAALRGLGGAGFPTGRKWRILRQQAAPRYLVVNIDEGEPGTFK